MASEVPKYLYRGIVINYEQLQSFDFKDKDLEVPYEPIMDEQGRKTVLDGNEYGVYMTDNETMVDSAYGNVHGGGTKIGEDIKIGDPPEDIKLPNIGITYKINTEGMEVHEPWISDSLKGHYNNGFQGKEYISERVPKENYTVTKIKIGKDLLHDEEEIEVDSLETAGEKVKRIMEERKERLEVFAKEMSKVSENKRRQFRRDEKDILKEIYGENGAKYINEDDLKIEDPNNAIKYLAAKVYKKDPENIDFKMLDYIESIKIKANMQAKNDKFESLENIILEDILKENDKREKFIKNKELEGGIPNTKAFDSRLDIMKQMQSILKEKENSKEYVSKETDKTMQEKFKQILTDYSGNEIGKRIVEDSFETETGERTVLTTGEINNEDGKYEFKETTKGMGTNLSYQRKEMNVDNRITEQKEFLVYQKDDKGNEMYYKLVNGKTKFRIIKNPKGTNIENYDDNGQLVDLFTYDKDGKALLGIEGMDKIEEDYIENFYDSQVPYFEAKTVPITEKEAFMNSKKIISTEELGKETLEEQKDVVQMDKVEKEIEQQMEEHKEKYQINEFGEIIRTESDEEKSFRDEATQQVKNDFRDDLRVNLSTEEQADLIVKQFEKELEEGKALTEEEKKKIPNHKVEKLDGEHIM